MKASKLGGLAGILLSVLATSGCVNSGPGSARECLREVSRIGYIAEPPNEDIWKCPSQTEESIKFNQRGVYSPIDCEDLSFLLQERLKKRGIKSEVVFGFFDSGEKFYHAWVETDIEGKKYILDATNGRAYARDSLPAHIYFPAGWDYKILEKIRRYKKEHNIQGSICSQYGE